MNTYRVIVKFSTGEVMEKFLYSASALSAKRVGRELAILRKPWLRPTKIEAQLLEDRTD